MIMTQHSPKPLILGTLAALFFAAGCDVVSTAQLPAIQDDRIVGEWMGPSELGAGKPPTERVLIKRSGTNYVYGTAEEIAKDNASLFSLAKVGTILIIQDASDKTKDQSEACKNAFHNSSELCRTLLGRVEIGKDTCTFHMFDSSRIAQDSLANVIRIPHEMHRRLSGDSGIRTNSSVEVMFTADAKSLESFLAA